MAANVAHKFQIEAALHAENQAISAGNLKEDNPLDLSENFRIFCEACRRGDLRTCQEMIQLGVNINARDKFDYTPLILASLCGHYEVAQLLLEAGALCERDTFQGERCLYNALNDRIRNLLLSYDYSKFTDPLQPFAAHITSLLSIETPRTTDITLTSATSAPFELHKFVLAARSPYFAKKLEQDPGIQNWKISNDVPGQSFSVAVRYLYLSEVSIDLGASGEEQAILEGIAKISKHLEIERLFEDMIEGGDRRLARQRRTQELERGAAQFERWFKNNVLKYKVELDSSKVDDVVWDHNNAMFADILLRADEDVEEDEDEDEDTTITTNDRLCANDLSPNSIAIRSTSVLRSPSKPRKPRRSTIYPAHRAILLRSDFFATMFSSSFREAQTTPHLQTVSISCSPRVLEIVLSFLYTGKTDFGLEDAIDVLFTADLLFIDKLKMKAATIISTLGNGMDSIVNSETPQGETDIEDVIDIFDVVRAGWDTRVQRLEEFGARYIAQRLEQYIDLEDFADLVRESANRVQARQETDTVELVDDIRYYLSERFRLRFEDTTFDETNGESGPLITVDGKSVLGGAQAGAQVATEIGVGEVRTLDGELAGDEFEQDAINYKILLGKIESLLEKLKLDA
ncbi:hypothetical protein EJ05DRAFT_470077 [Pseudovirgaria hyperparasitica]|uniref:BTB domain-containing protein n=1 Tax=Pseudovirgaria hyperparasitica TaxID=470096 RepID=A0A6A6VUJ5_9PEZI|nr:uncharacterized protein EJ05DRAFT_470077 [Pseudovirgaria hyperparasitica]KAF2753290.1 hypothetical protein EJ05DRAFT_470077 [Pseudovirgaria hyperparasitica]